MARWPLSDEQRFWAKVDTSGGCWMWQAGRMPRGYGRFWARSGPVLAHRFAYELAHGVVVPPGLVVCHHCDVPGCVRASHLFVGTRKDNQQDMAAKGRSTKGEQNPQAKLRDRDITVIVERYERGESFEEIAEDYPVLPSAISRRVQKALLSPPVTE